MLPPDEGKNGDPYSLFIVRRVQFVLSHVPATMKNKPAFDFLFTILSSREKYKISTFERSHTKAAVPDMCCTGCFRLTLPPYKMTLRTFSCNLTLKERLGEEQKKTLYLAFLNLSLTRYHLWAPQGLCAAAACTCWSSRSTSALTGCPLSPSRCPVRCLRLPDRIQFYHDIMIIIHH